MKPSALIANLREIAALGENGKLVQPALVASLSALSRTDHLTIGWLDEDCNPVDFFSTFKPRPEEVDWFLSEAHNRKEAQMMLPHRTAYATGTLIASWDVARHRKKPEYYERLMEPYDMTHAIRLHLCDGGRPLCAVSVMRTRDQPAFSRAERQLLSAQVEHLEQALARRQAPDPVTLTEDAETGFLIVDDTGAIQDHTRGAVDLLHQAADMPISPVTLATSAYGWARPLLREIARRAANPMGPAALVQVNRNPGRFLLRGYRMQERGRNTCVQLTRQVPLVVKLLAAPRVMALPAREKQVCLALARGLSTSEIAAQLGVQPSSVITHTRSLYRRLGINRREELVAAALAAEEGEAILTR